MPKFRNTRPGKADILKQIQQLRKDLANCDTESLRRASTPSNQKMVDEAGPLLKQLQEFRETISPAHFGKIGISLGRSDGIAKFFAFSFVNQKKLPLENLRNRPFYGSGVYAIYYVGNNEEAYPPLADTETPIYVGSADPTDPNAESTEEQGQQLFNRLKQHAANIEKTNNLALADFRYRAAPIQSGMQGAVEDFMIRLFRPIWNKEMKICFGIGKHGDKAETRRNKRSPWDTMHPGRKWADATSENQKERPDIVTEIEAHFERYHPIPNKTKLFTLLALD